MGGHSKGVPVFCEKKLRGGAYSVKNYSGQSHDNPLGRFYPRENGNKTGVGGGGAKTRGFCSYSGVPTLLPQGTNAIGESPFKGNGFPSLSH